ncbi:MAG: hypothetical protein ABIQ39_13660 [Ilumatobacteraceae bacterium]
MTEPSRALSAVAPFQAPGDEKPAEVAAVEPRTITINSGDIEKVTRHLAGIPDFEGKEVEFTAAKITSVAGLEIDDAVWRVDDYIRMVVECRVVAVHHAVNEKTGKLGRVHTIKAIDSKVLTDWSEKP